MPPVMKPCFPISVPSSATTLCLSGPMKAMRLASVTVSQTSVLLRTSKQINVQPKVQLRVMSIREIRQFRGGKNRSSRVCGGLG